MLVVLAEVNLNLKQRAFFLLSINELQTKNRS